MADPLDVLTLDEAKTVLNLTFDDTQDSEIEFYVTALSQRFDSLIGPIVKRAVTDYLDGGEGHYWGKRHVFLSRYPVSAITSVKEYRRGTATTLTAETNTSSSADSYRTFPYSRDVSLKADRLERRNNWDSACFEPGVGNIEVVYTAGRVTTTADVPEYIKEALGFTLMNSWRSQEDSTGGHHEFYVPQSYFPRWTIPNAAKGLVEPEIQEPRHYVG